MQIEGIWKNKTTGSLLRILSLKNKADDYEWHYGFDGENFKVIEEVRVRFMKNDFAQVVSKNIGTPLVYVDDRDHFRMEDEVFERLDINPFAKIK